MTCWACGEHEEWEECPDRLCFGCAERGVECGRASGRINIKECSDLCPQKYHWTN